MCGGAVRNAMGSPVGVLAAARSHRSWRSGAARGPLGSTVLLVVNTRTFTREVRTRSEIVPADTVVWDRVDGMIQAARASGATRVTIPLKRDNWAGLEDVGTDVEFWVNQCVSQYYGVQVVADSR